jgi:Na+-transporting NADH:ubiquinone oxidoreductase subunit NqrC
MKIDMETFTLFIVLAAVISVTIILADIVRRIEQIESYVKNLSKNDRILAKRGNVLYQKIEKLFETNARNEMEKEDEKSFINKLLHCVKMDNENITFLFENTEINDATIRDIEENITTLFKREVVYHEQKKQN